MYKDETQELARFYKTPIGNVLSDQISLALKQSLGDVTGKKILVLGPKLIGMTEIEQSCGEIHYKAVKDTSIFPFSDDSFHIVIVLHSLEFATHIKGLLREVWRVTVAEGSAVFLAPNRLGWLARSDKTPFGYGQPFTKQQFKYLLTENSFHIQTVSEVLCMPVWSLTQNPKTIKALDNIGQFLWPQFCGAYLIAAKKSVFAIEPTKQTAKATIATATAAS